MTTHMSELNDGKGADVDTRIMPLVKFINKMGMHTLSSHEGTENGVASVSFTGAYLDMANFLFGQMQPMVSHLGASVQLLMVSHDGNLEGRISFDHQHLEDVTKRLGCWVEMLHK